MTDISELLALDRDLERLELLQARDSLAVYAGLHIPAEIEVEDLPGMDRLSLPARYIPAEHHRLILSKLEAIERGHIVENGKRIEFKRLMIFCPPGSAKSTYGSVIFPSWYLGRNPTKCVIQGSYNDDLASRFGRRARNMFSSDITQSVFGVALAKDSKAAGEWETERGGEYFSFGVNVGVTGRRADGIILDDIIKGRKEADSKTIRESTWQTYLADIRSRMKPGAWITYIATRWHEDDPAGRILPKNYQGRSGWYTAQDGERWYVLSLPAVIETKEDEDADPLARKVGDVLWPQWFSKEHFAREKAAQGARNWESLYQQRPKATEGAILKRKHWRKWPESRPPKCEYVVSVYDTAFEEKESSDFSARTTWGVFWHEEERDSVIKMAQRGEMVNSGRYCCILLERWKDRVEFPALRSEAARHYKEYQPDRVLIEKKASGHSLIQELRKGGVPVSGIKVDRSKTARAQVASIVLEQGCVFYLDRDWSEEVIGECEAFPTGEHDDIVDTAVHAWMWLRKTYHLNLKDEDEDDEQSIPVARKVYA